MRGLVIIVAAVAVVGASAAQAGALTVTTTQTNDPSPSGTGSCPSAPCSLRQAINYVGAGGTVNLRTPPSGNDVYMLTQGPIDLNAGVTINGVDPRSTVIDGVNGGGLVDQAAPQALVVDNVTLTGASGMEARGFVQDTGAPVTLSNVSITQNNNTGMPPTFPGLGGGLAVVSGTVTLLHSSVTGNSASGGTGGIAGEGGGVAVSFGGTLNVVDSTIASNGATAGSAPGAGGGVYVAGLSGMPATLNLSSSTVAGNRATGTGSAGGNIDVGPDATVNVTDSIVAGGSAAVAGTENCSGALHSLGFNVEDRNQCGLSAAGDQVNANPLLGPLQDNGGSGVFTQALAFNSPAVDRGNPNGCDDALGAPVTTDQRGVARGTPCDVGAFEGTYPPAATALPAISGIVQVGHVLTCTPAFGGAAPIALTISWLRDGVAIAGGSTYTVGTADAGHKLGCMVVATNADGSASATSAVVVVPVPLPPAFTGVGPFSRLLQLAGSKLRIQLACPADAVTSCRFTLTIATRPPKPKRHHKAAKPVRVALGTFTLGSGKHGAFTLTLSRAAQRIVRAARGGLAVTVSITARDGAGRSHTTSFSATIHVLKPAKKQR